MMHQLQRIHNYNNSAAGGTAGAAGGRGPGRSSIEDQSIKNDNSLEMTAYASHVYTFDV
jgi:hypothetical protein